MYLACYERISIKTKNMNQNTAICFTYLYLAKTATLKLQIVLVRANGDYKPFFIELKNICISQWFTFDMHQSLHLLVLSIGTPLHCAGLGLQLIFFKVFTCWFIYWQLRALALGIRMDLLLQIWTPTTHIKRFAWGATSVTYMLYSLHA